MFYGSMASPISHERPYRSHLRPACIPCRRRKSRCTIEASSPACLMCRVHGSDCTFPRDHEPSNDISRSSRREAARRRLAPVLTPLAGNPSVPNASQSQVVTRGVASASQSTMAGLRNDQSEYQLTPLSVDDAEQENPHIVGPANTNDSQVLADYLSIISNSNNNGGLRMVRPVPASRSKPVLFATVKKRPIGVDGFPSPAREKLHIIEQLLEPYVGQLTNL